MGIIDGLILANQTAQVSRQIARAGLQRRISQGFAGLHS
jgi:hypothetical protein